MKSMPGDSGPQKLAIIATVDNKPLGWVNRHGQGDNPFVWFIGTDIREDDYLDVSCKEPPYTA